MLNKIIRKISDTINCLKDNSLFVKIKEKMLPIIEDKKQELLVKAEEYIKDKSPKIKEELTDFIMNNVKLGFPANLFKGKIKKIINKNFDKLIDFILNKIQGDK